MGTTNLLVKNFRRITEEKGCGEPFLLRFRRLTRGMAVRPESLGRSCNDVSLEDFMIGLTQRGNEV